MGCLKLDILKNHESLLRVVGKISTTKKRDVDYYPFGSPMPNRHTVQTSSDIDQNGNKVYRYGFNGMEKDDEVTGVTGATYDYGERIYDARTGRFLSIDALSASFPWWTPYQFAGNTPIQAIDLDGLEILDYRTMFKLKFYKTELKQGYYLEVVDLFESPHNDWSKTNKTIKKLESVTSGNELNTYASNNQGQGNGSISPGGVFVNKNIPLATKGGGVIYSPGMKRINNMMGQTTEMDDSPIPFARVNNNNKPSKGAALAYSIEALAKWGFTMTPAYQKKQGYKDMSNMTAAYEQAYNSLLPDIDFLMGKISQTGWDSEQFISDILNYVVDGKSPASGSNDYDAYVVDIAKISISLGNNQKTKMNAE